MLFKFHKNAIIVGSVDSYCLVCKSHLRNEEDIDFHIAKPIHIKNLEYTGYLDKYKNDFIRKVQNCYFCESCNILLNTATKVGLHITDLKHIENKSSLILKCIGNYIVAFDNVLISEKAWNGLIENTCAICNTEFDNEGIHKTDPMHVINLIQRKIQFGNDNSLYRKMDESTFQCITCNVVLALNSFSTHFHDADHKMKYSQCEKEYIDCNIESQKAKKTIVETNKPEERVSKPVVNTHESNKLPEKVEIKKATEVKKPEPPQAAKPEVKKAETVTVTPKKTIIEALKQAQQIQQNVQTVKKTEKSKSLAKGSQDLDELICEALKAKDYIAVDENNRKWCLLCDWTLDDSGVYTHVKGKHHLTLLKLHKERLKKNAATAIAREADSRPDQNSRDDNKKTDNVNTDSEQNKSTDDKKPTAQQNRNIDNGKKLVAKRAADDKKLESQNKVEGAKKAKATEDKKAVEFAKAPAVIKKKKEEKQSQVRASSAASNREDEDLEKLAKVHSLVFQRNINKVYCPACKIRITPSTANIKEHVSGTAHKNKQFSTKQTMKEFVKGVVAIENDYSRDVIINEKFVMNYYSFLMINNEKRNLQCEVCRVPLKQDQVETHKSSAGHNRAMCETMIITSEENEFIRELSPEVFHCGYCNFTVETIEDLKKHLESTSHREAKTVSIWRLNQYIPDIMMHRAQNPPKLLDIPDLLKIEITSEV